MSLVRYSHPMLHLQQQVNRMFDQFDSDLFGRLEDLGNGMFTPAVDVKEDAEAYTVHLEVPGVAQDNLQLTLQDNVLTIKGTKEKKSDSGEGRFRRVERSYGSFVRSLSLPRSVDGAGVTANLEDGVLEVRLPKREEARPRQINVGVTRDANGSAQIMAHSNGAAEEDATPTPTPTQIEVSGDDSQEGNTQAVGGNSEDAPEGNPT
jgi:HSP20 family protein